MWGSATHKQTRTSTHLMRSMLVAMASAGVELPLRLSRSSQTVLPPPSSSLSLVLHWGCAL